LIRRRRGWINSEINFTIYKLTLEEGIEEMTSVWIILPNPGIGNDNFLIFEDSYRSKDLFEQSVHLTYSKVRKERKIEFEYKTDRMIARVTNIPQSSDEGEITDTIVARKHNVGTMPQHL
jgi:hypothetical protein